MNQTLECYLRCYINYQQDNWAELLACAEFASNNMTNTSTGVSPNDLVYASSWTPAINIDLNKEPPESDRFRVNESDVRSMRGAEAALKASTLARKNAEKSMKRFYDKRHKDKAYKEGTFVMLNARNIRTIRVKKKLADKFIGPFKILKRIGANAYKLELPVKYGKLHHTFHISLLEEYHLREGCEPPEPVDIDGDEEWEVEEILDERKLKGKTQFYVRWKGFSEAYDGWEPERHLEHAQEAVKKWRQSRSK